MFKRLVRMGTTPTKFQYALVLVECQLTIKAAFHMCAFWTRGPRIAKSDTVVGVDGRFQWDYEAQKRRPLMIMCTLYKDKGGKFQKKKSRVTIKQMTAQGTTKIVGGVELDLSLYADSNQPVSKEFDMPMNNCADRGAHFKFVIHSRPMAKVGKSGDDDENDVDETMSVMDPDMTIRDTDSYAEIADMMESVKVGSTTKDKEAAAVGGAEAAVEAAAFHQKQMRNLEALDKIGKCGGGEESKQVQSFAAPSPNKVPVPPPQPPVAVDVGARGGTEGKPGGASGGGVGIVASPLKVTHLTKGVVVDGSVCEKSKEALERKDVLEECRRQAQGIKAEADRRRLKQELEEEEAKREKREREKAEKREKRRKEKEEQRVSDRLAREDQQRREGAEKAEAQAAVQAQAAALVLPLREEEDARQREFEKEWDAEEAKHSHVPQLPSFSSSALKSTPFQRYAAAGDALDAILHDAPRMQNDVPAMTSASLALSNSEEGPPLKLEKRPSVFMSAFASPKIISFSVADDEEEHESSSLRKELRASQDRAAALQAENDRLVEERERALAEKRLAVETRQSVEKALQKLMEEKVAMVRANADLLKEIDKLQEILADLKSKQHQQQNQEQEHHGGWEGSSRKTKHSSLQTARVKGRRGGSGSNSDSAASASTTEDEEEASGVVNRARQRSGSKTIRITLYEKQKWADAMENLEEVALQRKQDTETLAGQLAQREERLETLRRKFDILQSSFNQSEKQLKLVESEKKVLHEENVLLRSREMNFAALNRAVQQVTKAPGGLSGFFSGVTSSSSSAASAAALKELELLQARVLFYETQLREADATLTTAKDAFTSTNRVLMTELENMEIDLRDAQRQATAALEFKSTTDQKMKRFEADIKVLIQQSNKKSELMNALELQLLNKTRDYGDALAEMDALQTTLTKFEEKKYGKKF